MLHSVPGNDLGGGPVPDLWPAMLTLAVARNAAAGPSWSTVARRVKFRCPNGHSTTLWRPQAKLARQQHTIQADGSVTPAVVCRFEGCGFEADVHLEGWDR